MFTLKAGPSLKTFPVEPVSTMTGEGPGYRVRISRNVAMEAALSPRAETRVEVPASPTPLEALHVHRAEAQLLVVVADANFHQHDVVLGEETTELLEGGREVDLHRGTEVF
jgi:hypothetical protein